MIYGSVCSGIEAATAAWHPLGWKASFFSEIEAFPRSVLAHHYPETPLHGDFTTIKAGEYEPIDLLVGGTPCQSFSIAGLRGGLDDDRGSLALEYLRLVDRLRPRWLVWENVPGVLSSNGGRDFGSILGGMGELGYGVAYRVLDAQFFGVAQRRRRVFVVGYLGDWRRAAAALFERHSLSGYPAPRREKGPGVAALTANGVGTCGADDNQGQAGHLIASDVCGTLATGGGGRAFPGTSAQDAGSGYLVASTGHVAHCLNAGGMGRQDYETERLIAHTLKGEGFDASEDGTGRGTPIVPCAVAYAIQERAVCENPNAGPDGAGFRSDNAAYTLEARTVPQAVAFQPGNLRRGAGAPPSEAVFPTLKSDHGRGLSDQHPHVAVAFTVSGPSGGFAWEKPYASAVMATRPSDTANTQTGVRIGSAVRRLTPRECERLQGFPDDFTLVPHRGKPAADGPRYKALGNSMAVPCMAWIGQRIAAVDALPINLAVAS